MLKAFVVSAFALVALVGTPHRAHAQFATLDRQNGGTDGGVTFDYLFVNHDVGHFPNTSGYRVDFFGQFVEPTLGIGGYIALPISHAVFDADTPFGNIHGSGTGVGDLEIGGIYELRSRRPETQLILHAGLALPTAQSSNDDANANVLGTFARPTDLAAMQPKATTLRVGFSPIWHRGNLIARLDLGIDLNVAIADGRNTLPPVLRLNGGIGFRNEQFAIMGELTNTFVTGDRNDNGDVTLNEAAVSAAFFLGQGISASVALVLPLEEDTQTFIDLALQFGLVVHL
jgi:hypothetical protein